MDLGTLRRSLRRRPLPGGGLYFLRGSPRRSEIHWAAVRDRSSVDTRAIWDRLVSHLRLSSTALSGTAPSAAAFAYLSAISLPGTSWWAGTHPRIDVWGGDAQLCRDSPNKYPSKCQGQKWKNAVFSHIFQSASIDIRRQSIDTNVQKPKTEN